MNQATESRRQLVIIDSKVTNWQHLINDVDVNTTVLMLDSVSDGLTQISDYLSANLVPFQSIHIVSHGSVGSLLLGSSTVTSSNLNLYLFIRSSRTYFVEF